MPESIERLESRMGVMVAGCLLMRVDGISSLWLPWVHNELQKEITRQLAVKLVLEDDHYPLVTLLKQAFSDL